MKYKSFLAIALVLVICLSGCKGNGEGSIAEDYERLNEEIGQSENSEIQVTEAEIPEHMDYEVFSASGMSSIDCNADVQAIGLKNAAIIEITETEITDEYLLDLADKLFDGGYTVKKPYCICTMDELLAERDYIKEMLSEYPEDEGRVCETMYEVVNYIEDFNEERVRDLEEGEVIVHVEYSGIFINGLYGPEERSFDIAMIQGTIGDRVFQLYYGLEGESMTLKLRPLTPYVRTSDLCNMESTLYEELFGENICNLDDSRTMAESILNDIGYADFKEHDVAKRRCQDSEYVPYLDGYYFWYSRDINGYENSIYDNPRAILYDELKEGRGLHAGQEYICIKIDHEGLVGIEFGSRYTIGKTLSENVQLMDFAQIDEIAQKHMAEVIEKFEDTYDYETYSELLESFSPVTSIDEIAFTYIPIQYDGKFVYVPAWAYLSNHNYYSDNDSYTNQYALMAINAIDGSIIHMDRNKQFALAFWWDEP